jgi:tRNA(fMet)-specific endonuclease VapC
VVTHLLDTNTISYAFRGEGGVAAQLASMPPTQIGIPAPVLYESLAGIGKLAPGARRTALEGALLSLAKATQVIPFDQRAAELAAQIRVSLETRGAMIGPIDIQIAGIALANQARLVTRNTAEFGRVNGLLVVDWYGV